MKISVLTLPIYQVHQVYKMYEFLPLIRFWTGHKVGFGQFKESSRILCRYNVFTKITRFIGSTY